MVRLAKPTRLGARGADRTLVIGLALGDADRRIRAGYRAVPALPK